MKAMRIPGLFMAIVLFVLCLTACDSNSVQQYVVAAQSYTDESAIKNAAQPDSLAAGQEVYASVAFIESPQGMEYTARWSMDGKEVKSETKAMITDKTGVLVFSLKGEQVKTGKLKLEILYKSDVLCSKELSVENN